MKIHQIEKSLTELMEEDQKRLNKSLKNIEYIQADLKTAENELIDIENNVNKYKLLNIIKNNKLINIYIIATFFELPICLYLVIMLMITTITIPTILIFIATSLLGVDWYKNFTNVYSVISYDKSGIEKITNTLKELFKSKDYVEDELKKAMKVTEKVNDRINELTNRRTYEFNNIEYYRDELSSIEGYLIGITKVIEKNIINELPDTNDIVYYVNRKLELKKNT